MVVHFHVEMVSIPQPIQSISRSPSVQSIRSVSSNGSRGSKSKSNAGIEVQATRIPTQDRGSITGSGRIKQITRPNSASSNGSKSSRK
jgi:hypothetical protein